MSENQVNYILLNLYLLMQGGSFHEAHHLVNAMVKIGVETPSVMLAHAVIKFKLDLMPEAVIILDDLQEKFPDFLQKNETERNRLLSYMRLKTEFKKKNSEEIKLLKSK